MLPVNDERLDEFISELSLNEKAVMAAFLNMGVGIKPLELLGQKLPDEILSPDELEIFYDLSSEDAPAQSGMRPSTVMIMKATRLCNLRCTYCHSWKAGPNQVMEFSVLVKAIRDSLLSPSTRHVEFVWHGGEVTLLSISFYRKALWLQQQFKKPGLIISNSIQTNGTLLSQEWLSFLKLYGINVGVSLDGPPLIHDKRRVDAKGNGTFCKVREGIDGLKAMKINYGVLMVVDEETVKMGAKEVLEYLLELDVSGVGLLNAIPENTSPDSMPTGNYLEWPRFVIFLRDLFRIWWPQYKDRIAIRELSSLAGKITDPSTKRNICNFAGNCMGQFLTIDPNGDVSACDKYIGDSSFLFGNLMQCNLSEMLIDSHHLNIVKTENANAVSKMQACSWFPVCNGGCPHDRRLNEFYVESHNQGCCGLSLLLDEMEKSVLLECGM